MRRASSAGRPVLGLCVVGLGASLPPLDLAVNVAFPAITAAFSLDTPGIRWVVAAYVVSYASLMLAFGSLGDLIGYRRIFRAGLVLGAVAFVLCALAPDYGWLLAARTVQGVAAALLLSCAPALATSLFEESRRIWVLGAYSSMAAAAGVVAPLLGGASIAVLGWAGVFWFRVPIALLALLLLPALPVLPHAGHPLAARRFDAAGASLLGAGIAMLLLAPTLVQATEAPWLALSVAVAGTFLFAGFLRHQRRAAQTVLPLELLRDSGFVFLNLVSSAVHFCGFTVPLIVPYYLTRISGYGPLDAGGVLTAWPLGMLAGSALGAPAARAFGRGRTALIGGGLLVIGLVAIGFWPAALAALPMLPGLFLHGAGIGLFQVAYTDMVIAMLPQHARGVAGSLTILTRTVGIMLGAAGLSAALQLSEAGYLTAGRAAPEAFLAAFQSVFQYAAAGFAILLALSCLHRRVWVDARGD